MRTLLYDVRYGMRLLLKRPGFSLIATLTLTLGISSCTVVFSIVAAIVYPPLPTRDPARIVAINEVNTQTGMSHIGVSLPDLDDWKARSGSIEQFAAMKWPGSLALSGGERPEAVRGGYISANMFGVLD